MNLVFALTYLINVLRLIGNGERSL